MARKVIPEQALYKRIRQRILKQIIDREWNPGDCLPSEHELGLRFDVSQGTVRKALSELEAENIVIRRQGKGTFVARHNSERSLFRFFHIRGQDGSWQEPLSDLINSKSSKARPLHQKLLALGAGEKVYTIQRIRRFDNKPVIVEEIILPSAHYPGLLKNKQLPNTLYQYYEEHYSISIARAQEKVTAIAASEEQADLLQIPIHTPLLRIERTAYSLEGRAVELRISYCQTEAHYYQQILE